MARSGSSTTPTGQTRHPPGRVRGSEAELARLWAAQAFGAAPLHTVDGAAVEVGYPGRPGGRAGPDFRDAVIRVGSAPVQVGDVELHREARDFARHGHAVDRAYDRVLLHVVFTPNDGATTALPSGREAPVLAVAPGPAAWPLPRREHCAAATSRHGRGAMAGVLRQAGLWRLRRKAADARVAIERDGPAQALYAALAIALGQTANAAAFALLAERAPLSHLLAEAGARNEDGLAAELRGRLLHAAGLDGALLTPGPALPWVTAGQRPAAHPARRIVALARLLARLARPDLVAGGHALIGRARQEGARTLIPALSVAAPAGPALCGRARAVEVAINALLPWASAVAALAGDDDGADTTLLLAGDLPTGEPYGAVAHLRRNLRDHKGRTLITSALTHQGALALLGEWCRRGGCGRCPLS